MSRLRPRYRGQAGLHRYGHHVARARHDVRQDVSQIWAGRGGAANDARWREDVDVREQHDSGHEAGNGVHAFLVTKA